MGWSEVEFRVIEGGTDYDAFYLDFKRDFLNPKVTMEDLMKKYKISRNRYNKLRQMVFDETGLVRKPQRYRGNRPYINVKDGKWAIIKMLDGAKVHFGSYDNLDTAMKIRDELQKVNWDKEQLAEIREKALLEEKIL